MKTFLTLIVFTASYLLSAQSVDTQMQYDAGRVFYRGERYAWSYKVPAKVAENCGCDEAASLFRKADKQRKTLNTFFAGAIGTEIVLGAVVLQSNSGAIFLPALGIFVMLPGFIPYYGWLKNGPRAVYEYNRCIESRELDGNK